MAPISFVYTGIVIHDGRIPMHAFEPSTDANDSGPCISQFVFAESDTNVFVTHQLREARFLFHSDFVVHLRLNGYWSHTADKDTLRGKTYSTRLSL